MASSFGVQLKKADGSTTSSSPGKGGTRTPGGAKRSVFRTQPVSDLKAMFNKKDGIASGKETVTSVVTSTQNTTVSKTGLSDKRLNSRISSTVKTTTPSKTPTTPSKTTNEVSSGLTDTDRDAFEALKNRLNKIGIENLLDDEDKPAVVVAKTYSGGKAYTATLENKKVQSTNDDCSGVVSKSNAVSVLSFGLTKLRTRPGSLKGDEEKLPNLNEEETEKRPSSPHSFSPRPNSPGIQGLNKDSKYIAGAARGWKANNEHTEACNKTSPNMDKTGKFNESSVGKVREEAKQEIRVKGFRSVSPVNFNVFSSDDSSSSSNLSPRGYKPNVSITEETKTDVNENIRKFGTSKSDSNLLKYEKVHNQTKPTQNVSNVSETKQGKAAPNSRSKLSAVEQLALDKEKMKFYRNSGSISSDSENGKRSPKVKDNMKWMDKSRISAENLKQQTKVKGEGHRPLSRASSSGSNSSLKQSKDLKSRIEMFGSPEPIRNTPTTVRLLSGQQMKKKDFAMSRKIGTGKFQDIKKSFESETIISTTKSPSVETKPNIQINTRKQMLARKQSFEGGEIFRQKTYENKEIISPRDRGNVLESVQALKELDAKAKAQPVIVRRTKSLPSETLEDESSLDYEDITEGPYYFDMVGKQVLGDVSNEGDISSEAELYEEIPTNRVQNLESKKEYKGRRFTAFKKKRKACEDLISVDIQTGTEGDIDSDSNSSNSSGIYEHLEHGAIDDDTRVSESDSVNQDDPPELPPARTPNTKKKKTKGEKTKGFRGKIKKLYKGRSVDTEALKSATGSGMTASPPSTGIMSSLGDKLKKNLKKTKSSSGTNLEALSREDIPVCESEGTDTDLDQEQLRSTAEKTDELSVDNQGTAPPPLPPRQSGLIQVSSGEDTANTKLNNTVEVPNRLSATTTEYLNNRLSSTNIENKSDPPLPPRNRISNNLDLNIVVPITPGGDMRKSAWPPSKDSYLHGQKILNTTTLPDMPYMDKTPSPHSTPSPSEAPPLPQRPPTNKRPTSTDSCYVDVGNSFPPLPNRPPPSKAPLSNKDSYVDVGDTLLPDSNYSLADEIRRELEKRPVSSAYIKAHDLATVPEVLTMKAPFQDMMKFYSQYDEDGLYLDLSDDQVYGTAGGRYKSHFESESLYQFYNKDKITRASKRKAIYSSFDESDEEGYYDEDGDRESVYEDLSSYSSGRGSLDMERRVEEEPAKEKISTLEMFGKKGTVMRALWAEMPEVKTSGVLETITSHERKLQESMFEIITSEATYLKSLNVLMDVFLLSKEFGSDMSDRCVLTRQERHVVFSNIGAIRDTSERFLSSLESRWKQSVVLSDICDIITEHASRNFECYVHYCSNQTFQANAVMDMRKKLEFVEALVRLESHPDCQGLPMISFLLLPMQRVTRLPLLVDAICHRMDPIKDKARHKSAVGAFTALSKVVKKCNDGAKKMQQTEQMYHIAKQIDFPTKEIAQIPLISSSRYLVKQGEVTRIANDSASRLPFGKAKAGKQNIHIYLFNDILLITKKKGDRYLVTDYGQRNTLHIEVIDNPEKNARVLPLGVPSGCKHLFLLVVLENHEKKQVETVFACNSMSDRARWVDAVTPVKVTDDQRIYEEWDCPQVQCVRKYLAQEPDELTLEESDVVNVYKKLDDGMFEGERLRDGERGWFPKDNIVEIVNSHVRARNLRMKYRLMSQTEAYGS